MASANPIQVVPDSHREIFADLAEMEMRLQKVAPDELRALLASKARWRVTRSDLHYRCRVVGHCMPPREFQWPEQDWFARLTPRLNLPPAEECFDRLSLEKTGDPADDADTEAVERLLAKKRQQRLRGMH